MHSSVRKQLESGLISICEWRDRELDFLLLNQLFEQRREFCDDWQEISNALLLNFKLVLVKKCLV